MSDIFIDACFIMIVSVALSLLIKLKLGIFSDEEFETGVSNEL